jgi:hypothetical protein
VHRPRTIVDHLLRNSLGPIATSPELCVSRKAFRCCHTRGSHPKIAASSGWGPCSSSRVASLRRRTRPNRPLAGSMWGATRTHRKPCCNWRLVAEQADWAMVPRRHGRLRGSEPKASAKGPALWRLSRTTTQGRTLLSPAAACSLRWAKYWRSSLPDLLSTLKKKTSQWRLTVSAFALDSLEGGHGLRGISPLRLRVELRQSGGEVRLPGTRSPAQDQSSVLRQQRHQSLGHTFRYQRFEGQGGDGLEHDVYGRHSSDGVSHG